MYSNLPAILCLNLSYTYFTSSRGKDSSDLGGIGLNMFAVYPKYSRMEMFVIPIFSDGTSIPSRIFQVEIDRSGQIDQGGEG